MFSPLFSTVLLDCPYITTVLVDSQAFLTILLKNFYFFCMIEKNEGWKNKLIRLRELRKAQGFTLKNVADALNTSN